jgi:ribosomal protein S18 acetylase RimI-like enzyme
MTETGPPEPRVAGVADAAVIAQLLHDFNREFDDPTPSVPVLAGRIAELLESGQIVVLLVGEGPDGVAVLRFRPAIWSSGLESYLAELYVRPPSRGRGFGRRLMEVALGEARRRGADTMEIAVDEPDLAARRLYESLGFSNRTGGRSGPLMFLYERDLEPDRSDPRSASRLDPGGT